MQRILGATLALLAALPAFAGVVYEVENNNMTTSPGEMTTASIAFEGKLMKMDITSANEDQDGEIIFRADRREMVMVNHGDRSYFVLDEQQLRAIADQINQAMASMEQALAGMPESQRAQMEKMMKDRMPGMGSKPQPSELKKTGDSDTINGYPCVRYEVWRGDTKERELWVTDWSNVTGGSEAAQVFMEMASFMQEMLDSMPQMGEAESFGDATFEHMREMNGYPVMTREFDASGAVQYESKLISAQESTLDPADFEPPKNYKRKDIMKGMRR
jgi:hypothetical protein